MPPLPPLRFPNDMLRLLYWVFFKPITLTRYIRQFDPDLRSESSLFTFWLRGKSHPELRDLVGLVFSNILLIPCPVAFLIAGGLAWAGFNINWYGVVGGVVVGVAFGVVGGVVIGVTGGVVVGVTFGVAGGVVGGVAVGVVVGVAVGVVVNVVVGVAFGVAFGVVVGLMFDVVVGVAFGVAIGVTFGMAFGMAFVMAGDAAVGMAVGVAFGVTFWVSYFRLFLYLFELPLSFLLAWRKACIELSPMYWDELIWFPLLGLDQQIVHLGRHDRPAALAAIAYVSQSFRQGWAAESALLQLAAIDVEQAQTPSAIAIIATTLAWLPPKLTPEWSSFLPGLSETAAYTQAALESDTLYNRQAQYQRALERTRQLRQSLALVRDRRLAQRFGPALQGWEGVFERKIRNLTVQQADHIPNAYVAGIPLKGESKVFKGRRDLFLMLEQELASAAEQRPALLLFGGRRVGKTSTLRQFPSRLGPEVIPVEVNLEDPAASSDTIALLGLIAARIVEGARLRRVELLPLPGTGLEAASTQDPYLIFGHWLKQVEAALGEKWVLLALDEYEYLGRRVAEGRLDERIFQMLRDLVQNHPRFSLLLSGTHTLEDLPPVYSRYLLNVRVLKIGALAENDARELILSPIVPFPLSYDPPAVERLLQVCGCQPYFIQTACKNLVDALNTAKRRHATLEDVEAALDSALISAGGHFKDLWDGLDSDEEQRRVLSALANGQAPSGTDRRGVARLVQRGILVQEGDACRFQAELVARWVRKKNMG